MSGTVDSERSSAAERYLRFIEARCGPHVSAVPAIDLGEAGMEEVAAAGPSVLSLFEVDLGMDARSAAEHDLLIVLALGLCGAEGAPQGPVVLRFVTRSALRSAGRSHGRRWVANDIRIRTPPGLEAVSLLAYIVRRTPRLEGVLAAIEDLVEALEAGPEDAYFALARAVLERLEVLDGAEDAEIVLGGYGLRFGDRAAAGAGSRDARYVALVSAAAAAPSVGDLWLHERTLLAGPDRASAKPLEGRPYLLLRFGARSTEQSVREFIDEIRRRNQRGAGQSSVGAQAESFGAMVNRQVEQRREERIQAMFGHHKMPPMVTPIALEVASNLGAMIALDERPPSRFKELLEDMRASIQKTYGPRVPGVRVRLNERDLPDGTYIIMLDEIPLASGNVDARKSLCLAPVEQLPRFGCDDETHALPRAESATMPDGSGRKASWIPTDWAEEARKAGIETWDAPAVIQAHLRSVVVNDLRLFAPLDEIERALSAVDGAEALLARVREAQGGLPRFVEILHGLLSERLPITPIEPLAQQYLALVHGPTVEVAEDMRLAPAVRAHLTRDLVDWHLFTLDETFEAWLREGVICEGDGAILALEPELTQQMLTAVRSQVQPVADAGDGRPGVIVVEDWRLRPFVRSLVVLEFPSIRVVARREIEGLANVPLAMARVVVEP